MPDSIYERKAYRNSRLPTKRQRLENLYRLARSCTDRPDEQQALDKVWQYWSLPGLPYAGG